MLTLEGIDYRILDVADCIVHMEDGVLKSNTVASALARALNSMYTTLTGSHPPVTSRQGDFSLGFVKHR